MTLSTKCGLAFALGIALVLSGCDSKTNTTDTEPGASPAATSTLKGEIKINGSSTVQPISNAIRELFIKEHPGVSVDVGGDGTGNGFKDFYGKITNISDASRPIKPSELEKCNEAGVKFVEIPVAYDGLTIVVHPENDWVKELTIDQLKQIFAGEAGMKWKDVDSNWPDEVININAPGTGSGTYDYFKEIVAKPSGLELRSDMKLSEDDNALVVGVAGNQYSIGFFGVAYFEENKDRLRAVPYRESGGQHSLPSYQRKHRDQQVLTLQVDHYSFTRTPSHLNTQRFKPSLNSFCQTSRTCAKRSDTFVCPTTFLPCHRRTLTRSRQGRTSWTRRARAVKDCSAMCLNLRI